MEELGNSEVPKTLSKVARERVTPTLDVVVFIVVCIVHIVLSKFDVISKLFLIDFNLCM